MRIFLQLDFRLVKDVRVKEMEFSNLLLRLLTTFSSSLVEPEIGANQDVLRDFDDCGQLGDEDKKECIWGCDWEKNQLYQLNYDEKFEVIFQQINNIGNELQINL